MSIREELEQYLEGTCKSEDEAAVDLGITENLMLELLPQLDIERCTTCGWWCERHEMDLVDDEETCEDCREGEED